MLPSIHHASTEQTATVRPDLTLYASLELSRATWLVTCLLPERERMSKYSAPGGDGGALLGLLARMRARAQQLTGRPAKIVVIQEAGLDGFWVHRLLEANGIESHVVDPASIAVPVNFALYFGAVFHSRERFRIASRRGCASRCHRRRRMRRPERVPSEMRAEPSPAMTLGNAAKATVRKHRSSMTKATRSIFDLIQDRLQGADTRRQRVVVGIGLARCSRRRKSSSGISGGLRSRQRRAFACFNRWRPGSTSSTPRRSRRVLAPFSCSRSLFDVAPNVAPNLLRSSEG
jgi:hypothetical protein